MSQFFDHVPQNIGLTNQVENLAQEVDDAFISIEDILHQDNQINSSIASSIGSLDNKYIKEYLPNKGLITNYQQFLYFPINSQEASLDLYPSMLIADLNTVVVSNQTTPSITYTYKSNGILTTDTEFTFVGKKVVFGKAPEYNEALTITYKGYNTTSPDDDSNWPFELKYNILQVKQFNNTIVKDFNYTVAGNLYTVSGQNFKSMCSTFIQSIIDTSPTELTKYVAIFDVDGKRIDLEDVVITTSYVRFQTSENVPTGTVRIYVANSSVGRLIECIYRLFYAHDHGSNGGNSINHGDLLGLYSNTYDSNGNPVITYRTSSKKNYDHPQYLNREGFIDDPNVYNNAILGDLLLSSTSDGNRKNNLSSNSVKLIFGEHASGHKVYYNSSDECLWIDSISRNGIKLITPENKKALSINDHSFVDTQHITSNTTKALKLTLKAEDDTKLGVLKLTRKLINGGIATDDDKAKILSYDSEFSFTFIKDTLTIDNGAKISFGSPSVLDIVKENDGIHFRTEDTGVSTGASDVHFDVKVHASEVDIEHLDAEEIHLTDTQRIVFSDPNHESTEYEYINYDENLNIKSLKPTNFKNNGRLTGLTFDNRQFIYTSTPQGSTIADTVEPTDLYIENRRATYFIKTGYPFSQGVTNLQYVPRSDIYSGVCNANDVQISYDENLLNGVVLGQNNKIFAQKDSQSNLATILKSSSNVIVATNYTVNGNNPIIDYGKILAKEFVSIGDYTTSAGFTGNITVPLNHKLTVNGLTEFNGELTFNKEVTFTDNILAKYITALEIESTRLNVTQRLDSVQIVSPNIEATTELKVNRISQNSSTETSSFLGQVEFNNDVVFNKPAEFKNELIAKDIDAKDIVTKNLTVTEHSSYNELEVDNLEVNTELRFNSMLQTNFLADSSFNGPVIFNNRVKIRSNNEIIIGNENIEDRRNTDGLLLSSNKVKLGTNGVVSAGKVIAGKGTPSGNGDDTGGFAFSSTSGQQDGDTGMFAEKNIDSQNDSDLVFRVDGLEKLRIAKNGTGVNGGVGNGNEVVTSDILRNEISKLSAVVLDRAYPIGSLYMNTMDGRNPNIVLDWASSVWRRYAPGRVIISAEGTTYAEKTDSNLNKPFGLDLTTAGNKVGDFTHQLTVDEMPSHDHNNDIQLYNERGIGTTIANGTGWDDAGSRANWNTTYAGGDRAHNNIQPSIITHVWERIG